MATDPDTPTNHLIIFALTAAAMAAAERLARESRNEGFSWEGNWELVADAVSGAGAEALLGMSSREVLAVAREEYDRRSARSGPGRSGSHSTAVP